MDHWNSQVSSSDSAIRELQARERDLSSALDAKDAQLAVLRVRLQEADQELGTKRRLVEELRTENQRSLPFFFVKGWTWMHHSKQCHRFPWSHGTHLWLRRHASEL